MNPNYGKKRIKKKSFIFKFSASSKMKIKKGSSLSNFGILEQILSKIKSSIVLKTPSTLLTVTRVQVLSLNCPTVPFISYQIHRLSLPVPSVSHSSGDPWSSSHFMVTASSNCAQLDGHTQTGSQLSSRSNHSGSQHLRLDHSTNEHRKLWRNPTEHRNEM